MPGKTSEKLDLRNEEFLPDIDDWLELVALEDVQDPLDYVEDMTVPESFLPVFPPALREMHSLYFEIVHLAKHLISYYARPPDPKIERASIQQLRTRRDIASMFHHFILCPRGLLLTLEDEDGKEIHLTYARLGPFCQALDAERAFELLWDEKPPGWDTTEFKRRGAEELCLRYLSLLRAYDPTQPLYNVREVHRMSEYRSQQAQIREDIDRLSIKETVASKQLAAEQAKCNDADPMKVSELEDIVSASCLKVVEAVEQIGVLDRQMRVQYQIEKFISCRNADKACPRLKFEYPEEPSDGDATPKAREIPTDLAELNAALAAAVAASRDEWDEPDVKGKTPYKSKSGGKRKERDDYDADVE